MSFDLFKFFCILSYLLLVIKNTEDCIQSIPTTSCEVFHFYCKNKKNYLYTLFGFFFF